MYKSAVKFTKEQVVALKRLAQEKKLKGAGILNEFTPEQMVESFNGAGSSATPEWQRWLLTKILEKKLPSILIHDMAFRKGGTDEDFKRVNDELEENIRSSDDDSNSTWWQFVARKAKEYSNENGRPGWGMA